MNQKILLLTIIVTCFFINTWAHPKFMGNDTKSVRNAYEDRADSLHGFDVQKYTINLTINDTNHSISGDVTANVVATDNISSIDYNLIGLNVTQVTVNDVVSTYSVSNGLIHIPLTDITNGTPFTTKVTYAGTPSLSPDVYNIGMIFSTTTVFTLSDPDASRYWWPCYDHPWDKAVVDLNITMRSDWLVASNGIRTSIEDNGNGTKTHHWAGSHPMIPYLVCITASNYREINQSFGDIPIQNFVSNSLYNSAVVDFSDLPAMMNVFSQKYGLYPFEKYGNAVVNMQTFGAMEHQTMTTMGSSYIHGNHTGQYTIAHELAHQWYGNCVSPLTFKDVWLSEGFATYSEAVWEESQNGFSSMCEYIQSNFHNYYLNWESASSPQTIYNPAFNAYFNPPSYEKAASVLHMLRLQVGNATFWNILQTWFTAHHNGNATTEEFENLCEQLSGQDLTQFFQQWIYSAGIPTIQYAYFLGPYDFENMLQPVIFFAKTNCQSGGDFYMKLPLWYNAEEGPDSLIIDALPNPTNPPIIIINNLEHNSSGFEGDIHHWTLNRGITKMLPSTPLALASNNSVYLSWDPFWSQVPNIRYNVYRVEQNGIIIHLIHTTAINETHFLDATAQNGITYQYRITALYNNNYESNYTNWVLATPTAFPMDQGMLVIDETRDGTGTAISPTDSMVDTFYDSVLGNVNHTNYDFNTAGAPSLDLLSQYSTVLYHDDDFSNHSIQNITNLLGSYVLGGGNLIISGWKTAAQLPNSFLDIFFPGITVNYVGNADLVSVDSNIYPDLELDPAKLSTTWNGHLSMVDTFTNVSNPIFTGNFVDNSPNQGQALGLRTTQVGEFVLLGFPLYVMMEDGVREFLQQFLQETDPGVPVDDNNQAPVIASLSIYPNPFHASASIKYALPKAGKPEISIYNILGQKVITLPVEAVKAGDNTIQWDGRDAQGAPVANGIYFCRLQYKEHSITRKMLLLK